jgi:4-hydroxy-3-methylbut-2-enyl diphosphate reductase
MRITRAKHLGMCFGVRDAIVLALKHAQEQPLTVYGDLVHNETVLASLRQRGVHFQHELARIATPEVMITAHGASEKTIGKLRAQGFAVSQATCPLVHVAHRAVQRLVEENYHPVIIGKRGHVEVRGLTEDLAEFDIVLSEDEVDTIRERPRFGVVAQTTQPIDKVVRLVLRLRARFPMSELRFEDTVCQPTKQRQLAAVELAQQSDVVIVVGGPNSNNTKELVASCERYCERVFHVQGPADLRAEWFSNTERVGLTAGTSTPDVTIDAVEVWLRSLGEQLEGSVAASEVNSGGSMPAPAPAIAA